MKTRFAGRFGATVLASRLWAVAGCNTDNDAAGSRRIRGPSRRRVQRHADGPAQLRNLRPRLPERRMPVGRLRGGGSRRSRVRTALPRGHRRRRDERLLGQSGCDRAVPRGRADRQMRQDRMQEHANGARDRVVDPDHQPGRGPRASTGARRADLQVRDDGCNDKPTVLWSGAGSPGEIALDDASVYFDIPGSEQVNVCSVDGCDAGCRSRFLLMLRPAFLTLSECIRRRRGRRQPLCGGGENSVIVIMSCAIITCSDSVRLLAEAIGKWWDATCSLSGGGRDECLLRVGGVAACRTAGVSCPRTLD